MQRLSALPEVEEVQGGAEWVESLAQWQRLFQLAGLGVGAVLALAAILTVTTATTLVLHSAATRWRSCGWWAPPRA